MPVWLTSIGAVFKWAGELLGIIKKQQELRNTPAMQNADQAKKETENNNKIEETIKNEDPKKTGELMGE